jgi:hypothetical protein
MTVGEKLSHSAVQVQDALTSLTDTWTQTLTDVFDTASVDPLALLRPEVTMDQVFQFARRAFEINRDLIRELAGMSLTAEVVVGQDVATISTVLTAPVDPPEPPDAPIDVVVSEIEEPKPEAVVSEKKTVAAARYSRVSKAELQKALSDRELPATGTIKELRSRLIEADRIEG